jgi:Undecaprenyl-phosphate galactose phosphotransferase WbaP
MVEPEETEQMQLGMTSAVEQHLGNIPHVFVVSKMTGIPDHWNRHQMDEGLSGFLIEQHLLLPFPQLVKRGMDVAIALITGIMLLPLFIALGAATKLGSRGPIFYGHMRVGRGNTRFKAWKFRTMVPNADAALHNYLAEHPEMQAEWDRDHKLKNDPRVTTVGKWMRKWSIDELPQIWNVFCGDMSIVGPRPIVDAEITKYGEHFETFSSVLPGITGLWQVCGRNDTTYEERVQLDMYYVHHWSPWLDLYLLARTVKTVVFTRGAY